VEQLAKTDSVFKIRHPGRFWGGAILSTIVLGSIVYPSLGGHPELIALPIICGAAISVLTEVLSGKGIPRNEPMPGEEEFGLQVSKFGNITVRETPKVETNIPTKYGGVVETPDWPWENKPEKEESPSE